MLIKLNASKPETSAEHWNKMTSINFENEFPRVTVVYEVEKITEESREQVGEIFELLKKITHLQKQAGEKQVGFSIELKEITD